MEQSLQEKILRPIIVQEKSWRMGIDKTFIINGTTYKLHAHVKTCISDTRYIIADTYDGTVFIDKIDNKIAHVPKSGLCEYDCNVEQIPNDIIILMCQMKYIKICDTSGKCFEIYEQNSGRYVKYSGHERRSKTIIYISAQYIISMESMNWDDPNIYIYVRENMQKYIDTTKVSSKKYDCEIQHKFKAIKHAIKPDLVLSDRRSGFKNLRLTNNIITYTDSKGFCIKVTLPCKPVKPRIPIPEKTQLLTKYEKELSDLYSEKNDCERQIEMISHYEKQLSSIKNEIVILKHKIKEINST